MKQHKENAPGNLNSSDKEHEKWVDIEPTNFSIKMT